VLAGKRLIALTRATLALTDLSVNIAERARADIDNPDGWNG
jgi:hypothetical protein